MYKRTYLKILFQEMEASEMNNDVAKQFRLIPRQDVSIHGCSNIKSDIYIGYIHVFY